MSHHLREAIASGHRDTFVVDVVVVVAVDDDDEEEEE